MLDLDEDLRENLESDGFQVMPNISLTSWGATDISDLVNNTTIKQPDKVQKNHKPNACLSPSRMNWLTSTQTFEKITPNPPSVTITPKKTTNNTPTVFQDTDIDTKTLLA